MRNNSSDGAPPTAVDFDVAIVGAGISGINAGYFLETQAPAGTTYAILEGRNNLGGTWDLFRYPGIRSDSDIYTFGLSWNPWPGNETMASGGAIRDYLQSSAEKYGIDEKIHYNHKVASVGWSSKTSLWSLTVEVGGETKVLRSRFIVLGTGYYDYETPREVDIPGLENFQGTVIHPQFWPEKVDYSDKNVVIVGSGATAVTLLPSIAATAKQTTMLQRSPSYIFSMPNQDRLTNIIKTVFPTNIAASINRVRYAFFSFFVYWLAQTIPALVKRRLVKLAAKQAPNVKPDPHLIPRYNPWDQRICASPGGDFYAALRSGRATIVTDVIETITDTQIKLKSGQTLTPDVIVTATGLRIKFGGGIKVFVDGTQIDLASKFAWKGTMIQDVPNLVFVVGYVNASWTLRADTTSQMMVRLLHQMRQKGAVAATPYLRHPEAMEKTPVFNFTSTYLKGAGKVFPSSGKGQWKLNNNYFVDLYQAKWGDITTDLQLK